MSWPVTTFYCTKCDFKQGDLVAWGAREYVLSHGIRIQVCSRLGWCEDCRGLAAVEDLSQESRRADLEEATRELIALQFRPVRRWWELQWFILAGLWRRKVETWNCCAGKVDDAKDALNLIASRKTPPRCLACGSNRVTAPLVTDTSEWRNTNQPKRTGFLHPGCGGEMWMIEDGFRIALKPSIRRYTPEGDSIEQEDVDGYGHPDASYYDDRAAENVRIRGTTIPPIAGPDLEAWIRERTD